MEQEDKAFSVREKLGLYILIWLLKIVKPTQWSHEYGTELKKVEELIG